MLCNAYQSLLQQAGDVKELTAVLLREGMSLLRLLGVGCILGGAMLAEMSGKKTRSSFSE